MLKGGTCYWKKKSLKVCQNVPNEYRRSICWAIMRQVFAIYIYFLEKEKNFKKIFLHLPPNCFIGVIAWSLESWLLDIGFGLSSFPFLQDTRVKIKGCTCSDSVIKCQTRLSAVSWPVRPGWVKRLWRGARWGCGGGGKNHFLQNLVRKPARWHRRLPS